jgi:hypothetical protein
MAEELLKKEEELKRKEEEAERKRRIQDSKSGQNTKTKSELLLEAKKYDQQRRKKPAGNEDLEDPELVPAPQQPKQKATLKEENKMPGSGPRLQPDKLTFERKEIEKERKRLLREADEEDRRRELELQREYKESLIPQDKKYEKQDAQWASKGGKMGPSRDQFLAKAEQARA